MRSLGLRRDRFDDLGMCALLRYSAAQKAEGEHRRQRETTHRGDLDNNDRNGNY